MATPDVTVIIPTFNAVSTIDSALRSVMTEVDAVGKHVEILVIDGGSRDGTLARVARYSQVGVLPQKSGGLAAARNEAVATSDSPLVAFCDADDVWIAGSLAKKLDAITASADTWAVTGRVRFDLVESATAGLAVRRRAGEEHDGYTPGAILVRRRILEAVPFDERLTIAADTDWFIRVVSKFGDMFHLDETVLNKGLRAGSLSTDARSYREELLTSARSYLRTLRSEQR